MPIKPKRASVNSTIIFFDVVGYSKKDENTQFMIVNHINDFVKKSFLDENRFNENSSNFKTFSKIIHQDEIFIPGLFATGDGFLIVLDHNSCSPILLCEYGLIAIEFSIKLITEAKCKNYEVRIGINQGKVISHDNINGISFAGNVINDTQRMMDLGDNSHILLSVDVYNSLQENSCKDKVLQFEKFDNVPVKNKELSIYQLLKIVNNKTDKSINDKNIKTINNKKPTKIEHLQTGKSINEKPPIDVTGNRDYVYYIDNGKESEEVFIFLSGIGLDHYDFEKLVFLMGKRAIAFTLPSLEKYYDKNKNTRFDYAFNEYVDIAHKFITNEKFIKDFENKRIYLVGFSMGADIFHKILFSENLPNNYKNAILLDANHGSLEEMFITKVLKAEKPEKALVEIDENKFDFKRSNRSLRYLYDVFSKEQVTQKQMKLLAKSYYEYITNTINNKNDEISFNNKNKIISEKDISVIFLFRDGFTTSHINSIKNKSCLTFNEKNLIKIGLNDKKERTKYFDNDSFYFSKKDKLLIKYEHIKFFSGYNTKEEQRIGHFDLIEYKFLIEILYKCEDIFKYIN